VDTEWQQKFEIEKDQDTEIQTTSEESKVKSVGPIIVEEKGIDL
jgi:hypothetical protein